MSLEIKDSVGVLYRRGAKGTRGTRSKGINRSALRRDVKILGSRRHGRSEGGRSRRCRGLNGRSAGRVSVAEG